MNSQMFHFIGIGGIGMSALARILQKKGYRVQGSDQKESYVTKALETEGIKVCIGKSFEPNKNCTVVYSTAIQKDHPELNFAKELALPLLHRADLLQLLLKEKQSLLVAGTHGKTTTSALLASVLLEAETEPSFAIGGILQSLQSNGYVGNGNYFVAETDESDGSFLKLQGFGAIITNCEPEHLDYWKTKEALFNAFSIFCQNIQKKEHIFWCKDDQNLHSLHISGISYGFSKDADLVVSNVSSENFYSIFDLKFQGREYQEVKIPLIGKHNVLNSAAVFGLLLSLGLDEKVIRKAFLRFSGIKRRLEKKGEIQAVCGFDDYAHHPTEIQTTLNALKQEIHERRLIAIFQPHRATRTRDEWENWTKSFQSADVIILTDIFLAGEKPIEGYEIQALYTKMAKELRKKVYYFPRDFLEEKVASLLRVHDVLITLGAGDITYASGGIFQKYQEGFQKCKVALLCGGHSEEHPISLISAKNVHQKLDPSLYEVKIFYITREGKFISVDVVPEQEFSSQEGQDALSLLQSFDVVFPVLHGPRCEDGMIQAFLDVLQIPYVGCDYRSAAICMQKSWTKQIAGHHGVQTAPFIEINRFEYEQDPTKLEQLFLEKLTFPAYVKACHLGSSLGISKVSNIKELHQGAINSFSFDTHLIVEQEMRGKEVEFALLGNEQVQVAKPSILLTGGLFYDYERKYGTNSVKLQIPAEMTWEQKKQGAYLAKKVYQALGCQGLARIDFFLDDEGQFWLNEVNPMPGFTNISAYPKMWEASGLEEKELMHRLISLAFAKARNMRV